MHPGIELDRYQVRSCGIEEEEARQADYQKSNGVVLAG
jgi:hypothetical protein